MNKIKIARTTAKLAFLPNRHCGRLCSTYQYSGLAAWSDLQHNNSVESVMFCVRQARRHSCCFYLCNNLLLESRRVDNPQKKCLPLTTIPVTHTGTSDTSCLGRVAQEVNVCCSALLARRGLTWQRRSWVCHAGLGARGLPCCAAGAGALQLYRPLGCRAYLLQALRLHPCGMQITSSPTVIVCCYC